MATKKLFFPLLGKNVNFAATTQPQFSTPRMNNVRIRDVLENRSRGGQRPAFAKAYNQQIGGSSNRPVTVMCQVTIVEL